RTISGRGKRDRNGRACSDTRWGTSRVLNRLPPSFGARAELTDVLTDLPAASGDAVEAERLNCCFACDKLIERLAYAGRGIDRFPAWDSQPTVEGAVFA